LVSYETVINLGVRGRSVMYAKKWNDEEMIT